MNDANAIALLNALGVHNAELHGEWIRSSCPLAFHRHRSGRDTNPSFGIHYAPDEKSGYHCFGCNLKSKDVADLIVEVMFALKHPHHPPPPMDLNLATQILSGEEEHGYKGADWTGKIAPVEKPFEEFPSWWLDSFHSVFKHPEAMAYLNSRGVPPRVWEELDFRFDMDRKTVCFPFYNTSNKLAGMRGRFLHPKGDFRHHDYRWNGVSNVKLVLMGENHVDFLSPVVVVEGQFDYAKVYQITKNVVANLGTALTEPKLKKLENAVEVIGFFDDDEAGEIASQLMQQRLGYAYKAVKYPKAKKGEKLDPGKLTLQQITKALSSV